MLLGRVGCDDRELAAVLFYEASIALG